ncbi:hypothetical protein PV328_005206 [Microctonus aethiopoides]|uniref:CUB domain-containing protein n=1 Tax=Microctonus aethiopoides TaxID=144406 RepID=A0AA39KSC5_9HYME|nr:hypothetical protein PV328_005206 [Microctonus aethiopoides]
MQPRRWLAFTLLVLSTLDIFCGTIKIMAKTTRTSKAVKLPQGYMEIVEEETCSDSVIRLTCRSLRAFVFLITAEYQRDNTQNCGYQVNKVKRTPRFRLSYYTLHGNSKFKLRGNYIKDELDEDEQPIVDLRKSFNRRCSGHHHCRVTIGEHHPGAAKWSPGNVRLKYACIPEIAVPKYCNLEVTINNGETGYIKSPGYPLYYPGEYSCGWTFQTDPGHKVLLVFHDLSIRSPEPNGNCVDIIRIRENGRTLFESCGTRIGTKIISNSNKITLDLISSSRLFPARGFLLKYEAIGCPEVPTPNGSIITNDTVVSRTFQCNYGKVFPDTRQPTRTLDCHGGHWNESVENIPTCIASSTVILKSTTDNNRLSNLSGDSVHRPGVIIGRDNADAVGSGLNMDSAQPAMIKQADYVIDVVLPTILIALLFLGNAVIVYIIFQYRKRKVPMMNHTEEITLSPSGDVPQV